MLKLLAAFALLVVTAAPTTALELPVVRAQVACAPVTIADLLPPDVEPPPGEPPVDEDPLGDTDTETAPPPVEEDPDCKPFVYEMGSPFMHDVDVDSHFGAPRPEDRLHKGIDIIVPKMTPVFAVSDGVVFWVSDECCNVAIRHPDNWRSYYIHLNNDSFGTDDGLGTGVAPGIEEGVRVVQGQLLGWVGDSGNAEPTPPHLHFELRMPNGEAIDAAASFAEAEPLLPPTMPLAGDAGDDDAGVDDAEVLEPEYFPDDFAGPFADDDGHPQEWLFGLLASWGLLAPCDESGVLICPDDVPTGDAFQLMLAQAGFATPERPGVYERHRIKDPLSTLEDGVAVRGCGTERFCPDQPIANNEVKGIVARSVAPEWVAPTTTTLECDVFEPSSVTNAGLLLRLSLMLGAVIEPPCSIID